MNNRLPDRLTTRCKCSHLRPGRGTGRMRTKFALVEPASKADANEVRMVEPIECG